MLKGHIFDQHGAGSVSFFFQQALGAAQGLLQRAEGLFLSDQVGPEVEAVRTGQQGVAADQHPKFHALGDQLPEPALPGLPAIAPKHLGTGLQAAPGIEVEQLAIDDPDGLVALVEKQIHEIHPLRRVLLEHPQVVELQKAVVCRFDLLPVGSCRSQVAMDPKTERGTYFIE